MTYNRFWITEIITLVPVMFASAVLVILLLVRYGLQPWMCMLMYDLIACVFAVAFALLALAAVEPRSESLIAAGFNAAGAGWYAWSAWDGWNRNRKGTWAPGWLGKIVVDLGGRLKVEDV